MKGRYLVAIAFVVFLLFLGMNGYQFLCQNWSVTCVMKDGSQYEHIAAEADVKKFVADATKQGVTCASVRPVWRCPWD
jgi:hypothetical protein